MPAVFAPLSSQGPGGPEAGRRRHVHDLLHGGAVGGACHPAAVWPRLPPALCSHGAGETMGGAAYHLRLLPLPHLQGEGVVGFPSAG